MTDATLDYARLFETEIRPRRGLRRAAAIVVWAGLFVVRPGLALSILRDR